MAKKKTVKKDKSKKKAKKDIVEQDQEKHDDVVSENFTETTEVVPVEVEEKVEEKAEVEEKPASESVPGPRPKGAPAVEDCLLEYETKTHFIYKLKNHKKIAIKK